MCRPPASSQASQDAPGAFSPFDDNDSPINSGASAAFDPFDAPPPAES